MRTTHAHTHIHIHTRTYTHTNTDAHIHTQTHTHTYTHHKKALNTAPPGWPTKDSSKAYPPPNRKTPPSPPISLASGAGKAGRHASRSAGLPVSSSGNSRAVGAQDRLSGPSRLHSVRSYVAALLPRPSCCLLNTLVLVQTDPLSARALNMCSFKQTRFLHKPSLYAECESCYQLAAQPGPVCCVSLCTMCYVCARGYAVCGLLSSLCMITCCVCSCVLCVCIAKQPLYAFID